MLGTAPSLRVSLARTEADLRAAQRLRYEVFVRELGAGGPGVDHRARREQDRFDAVADHLLLRDARREDAVVGVYRLMDADQAARAGGFYSESEYDLDPLRRSGRRLLELGRSCLHRDYRGGAALMLLWQGLADHAARRGAEILFGVASFHGTEPRAMSHALSLLHHDHLAEPDLRVRARQYQRMDLLAPAELDRKRAMREMPALIKSYLRIGGRTGDGAFIDHAFNTTDICLILDAARLSAAGRARYGAQPLT